MVAKFTEKDLEKIETESELKIYRAFQGVNPQLGLPSLNREEERQFLLGNQRCAPKVWDFFERAGPTVRQRLFTQAVFTAILSESEIDRYELVCNNLEHFMMGTRADAGPNEKQAYRNFRYIKELSLEAMRYFADHFARTDYFGFSSSAYEQWFNSLRLGLYSNPERILNGIGNLNYPDLQPQTRQMRDSWSGNESYQQYSPRLEVLKTYLETIYELRIKVQLLDILIRNHHTGGDSPNVSMGQWERFIGSTRSRLRGKFGQNKGDQLFKKMFGSDNPTAPNSQQDFNAIQNEVLDQISQAILKEQMGEEWEPEPQPSGMNRDYAAEQREREQRAAEAERARQRRQGENDWSDLDSSFKNNPNLVKQWTDKGFTKEQVKEWINIGLKPDQSEYAQFLSQVKQQTPEQFLNEGNMEELKKEYEQWKTKPEKEKKEELKNNNIDKEDDQPKPEEQPKDKKRDKSPSRQAAEDKLDGKEVPPPKETGFNSSDLNDALNKLSGALDEDQKKNPNSEPQFDGSLPPLNTMTKEEAQKKPWICMGVELDQNLGGPDWMVYDPANFAAFSHGSGSFITLLLGLISIRREDDFTNVLHNFFWAKNLGTDKNPIKGFQRLVKDNEPTKEGEGETKLLITGKKVDDPRASKLGWGSWPWKKNSKMVMFGVPNVEQKSYRFTRMFRNQRHAYDLDSNKHFIGKLREKGLMSTEGGTRRTINWGSGSKKSILWITNQLNFPYSKNMDWDGDDIHTINPNNNYSHYLIFTNYTTSEIQTKAKPCKTLAQLVGQLKGTLVRLGPDLLELMDSQNEDQKDRSKDETPQTRKDTIEPITELDMLQAGITRQEFELLCTAFQDPAQLANIIKKLAKNTDRRKIEKLLNQMFDTIHEKTAENMYRQMVDHNPVFSASEKEALKKAYQQAKTKEEKKKLWEDITSEKTAQEAHAKKTKKEKDKIFEDQVNQNPRYGPPGEDTQDRRDRFEEYERANETEKENLQTAENERFTTGENASQWANYFQDNANRECGAGDETVGTETDNNFNGQFSFTDSLNAINKLKNIVNLKPEGMEEGMKSNKPYWQVVFNHPLTYIFLFIGILIAIMAAATRKNRT